MNSTSSHTSYASPSPGTRSPSPQPPSLPEMDILRPPYLPFRRISMTSGVASAGSNSNPPSKRTSIASAISLDSFKEDELAWGNASDLLAPPPPRASSRMSASRIHRRSTELPRKQRPTSSDSFASIDLSAVRLKLKSGVPTSRPQSRAQSRTREPPTPLEDVTNEKRLKIMTELWETEKSYVQGLNLVYTHFLVPLMESLAEHSPILPRGDLTTIFSNFVDIWNLHRSLLSDLDVFFRGLDTPQAKSTVTDTSVSRPPSRGSSLRPLSTSFISSSGNPPSRLNSNRASTQRTDQFLHHREVHDFLHVLESHSPYLSMYNPFVTGFPTSLSLLTALSTPPLSYFFSNTRPSSTGMASGGGITRGYEPTFAEWLKKRESDPRCQSLKLRDYLLTVIQRCPRYLLLLKDLLRLTSVSDPEYPLLTNVIALITKVTQALNESLAAHSQLMSLLALQKATPNLPFPLIVPGRTMLKRATMIKVDRGSDQRVRDVMLFSDCIIWISKGGENEKGILGDFGEFLVAGFESAGQSAGGLLPARRDNNSEASTLHSSIATLSRSDHAEGDESTEAAIGSTKARPTSGRDVSIGLGEPPPPSSIRGSRRSGRRTRSRSHPDPNALPTVFRPSLSSRPQSFTAVPIERAHGNSRPASVYGGGGREEERWWFRGRADLLDIEVVISPIVSSLEDERMFEILSPEGSFRLYAETRVERDAWVNDIRAAKTARLSAVQMMHPDSTLASSASNAHIRRALQALPHDPALPTSVSKREGSRRVSRRRKVDHFVPAIWVPDSKTETCMRCNSRFGWRRRRHHCRLCGKVVCAACSEKTFYITDTNDTTSSSAARACNACYESVFPLLPDAEESYHGKTPPKPSISVSAASRILSNHGRSLEQLKSPSFPSFPTITASTSTPNRMVKRPPVLSKFKASYQKRPSLSSVPSYDEPSQPPSSASAPLNGPASMMAFPNLLASSTSIVESSGESGADCFSSAPVAKAVVRRVTDDSSTDRSVTSLLDGSNRDKVAFPSVEQDITRSSHVRMGADIESSPSHPHTVAQYIDYSPSDLGGKDGGAESVIRESAICMTLESRSADIAAVGRLSIDLDVTPKATARKKPESWSSQSALSGSPIPDFGKPPTAEAHKAKLSAPEGSGLIVKDDRSEDTLSPLPNELLSSSSSSSPPQPSVVIHDPIRERRSDAVVSGGRSSSASGHQLRPFKKRTSIAPFPNVHPQSLLLVQDTPVTARTRVQGDGKARKFSLMMGTIRGGVGFASVGPSPNALPLSSSMDGDNNNERWSNRQGLDRTLIEQQQDGVVIVGGSSTTFNNAAATVDNDRAAPPVGSTTGMSTDHLQSDSSDAPIENATSMSVAAAATGRRFKSNIAISKLAELLGR